MMERIRGILADAPIDMRDILDMEKTAGGNCGAVLLAGSANASVLTLLEGVGLGNALAAVDRPCTVICTRGDALSILLHGSDGSVKCTGAADLAERLSWPENRGATVEISCPGELCGREKLIFAILDPKNFREQLNRHAAGCSGAVIMMNGAGAPPEETMEFARWLAEVCGSDAAVSVLVCTAMQNPNRAPALALAMAMGRKQPLPLACCNPVTDDLGRKLSEVTGSIPADAGSGAGVQAEMLRCALEKLAAERGKLAENLPVAEKHWLALEECFRAELPNARPIIKTVIADAQRNRLYEDMLKFSIFFQGQMEALLTDGLTGLEKPKDAIDAFAQGYLSSVLSDYCEALVNDMCRQEIEPRLQEVYLDLLKTAWIRHRVDVQELPVSIREKFDIAMKRMQFRGESVVGPVLRIVLNKNIGYIVLELWRMLDRHFMQPEAYARRMAEKLSDKLDEAAKQYQSLISESMIPQVESEILRWFDQQTQQIISQLAAEDDRTAAEAETQEKKRGEMFARIEAIRATEEALRACMD